MANWFERALASVSPATAARRAASRRRFELIEGLRAYDGASRGRRTQGWRTNLTSADAEVASGGDLLRQRSRDLVRNNPHAAKIVTTHADYIIGSGIVPRAATDNPALNDTINKLFDTWTRNCSPDGATDFYGLQYLAVREMIEGGDVFARKRMRKKVDPLPGQKPEDQIVPLHVQLLEAEFLDRQKNGPVGRNIASAGIEFDNVGGRRGYWLFAQHPGTNVVNPKLKRESQFVKATEVAHLYEQQRQQSVGVPWLTPIMISLRDLDDYNQAELIRKKIEACVVGVVIPGDDDEAAIGQIDITSDDASSTGLTDAEGFPIERFEPGMVAYAHGGKDIKFNNPAISAGIESYLRAQHRKLAAGARLPYELLTGDFSQSNFSANRMGVMAYRRFVEHVQWHIVIPQFCQPIWNWFIEVATLLGVMPENTIVPVEWSPPKHEAINPVDDFKADILAARAGIRSMPEIIAATGRAKETVLAEIIEWNAKIDEAKLVLDTDPRKVANNGQFQSTSEGDNDDDEK
jgi:lambda family phage portal protein